MNTLILPTRNNALTPLLRVAFSPGIHKNADTGKCILFQSKKIVLGGMVFTCSHHQVVITSIAVPELSLAPNFGFPSKDVGNRDNYIVCVIFGTHIATSESFVEKEIQLTPTHVRRIHGAVAHFNRISISSHDQSNIKCWDTTSPI